MEPTSSERPHNPGLVRVARRAMFPTEAHDLLESLREIVCEPARTKIIRALMVVAELTVGDLAKVIDRHRSSTSDHLRILRELSVVRSRRRGRLIYNALGDGPEAGAARQIVGTIAEIAAEASPAGPR